MLSPRESYEERRFRLIAGRPISSDHAESDRKAFLAMTRRRDEPERLLERFGWAELGDALASVSIVGTIFLGILGGILFLLERAGL